ncbi:hypothetical protein [Pectobacterium fontis]|uniref:Uncharacterized protein n=1 Tax=Pectobacterium fontis TaxID=2558042 RepID=A0A7V8IHJ4_9GAMM|nr:hypothetical protein [Pectobacterium fontis]KHN50732.1 hypothetical protein OI69_13805 [Pectobacterium fontis]
MPYVIFSERNIKVIEAKDGKKYLAGMELVTNDEKEECAVEHANAIIKSAIIADGVIQAYKLRETDEQRRIAALEKQIIQLSAQISHLQANQERAHFEKVRNSVIASVSRALDHQFDPKLP